jgi:hypothetical protein
MHAFPQPHHLPCPTCGESVARGNDDRHICDDERRLDYLLVQHGDELKAFDDALTRWLHSPAGRFAAWLAERDRHA